MLFVNVGRFIVGGGVVGRLDVGRITCGGGVCCVSFGGFPTTLCLWALMSDENKPNEKTQKTATHRYLLKIINYIAPFFLFGCGGKFVVGNLPLN